MKRPMYVIHDELTGFGSPFVDVNDASARRNFAYAVNNNGDTMSFNPKDYALYRLGEFDHDSAAFDALPCPFLIVRGDAVVTEK